MGHSTTAAPLAGRACTCAVWSEVLKVTLEAFTSPFHGNDTLCPVRSYANMVSFFWWIAEFLVLGGRRQNFSEWSVRSETENINTCSWEIPNVRGGEKNI